MRWLRYGKRFVIELQIGPLCSNFKSTVISSLATTAVFVCRQEQAIYRLVCIRHVVFVEGFDIPLFVI
jgi:hypothetical protein